MKWKPKHKRAAHRKAALVASFMRWCRRKYGRYPSLEQIALQFERSTTWAYNYRTLAIQYGYLRDKVRYHPQRANLPR